MSIYFPIRNTAPIRGYFLSWGFSVCRYPLLCCSSSSFCPQDIETDADVWGHGYTWMRVSNSGPSPAGGVCPVWRKYFSPVQLLTASPIVQTLHPDAVGTSACPLHHLPARQVLLSLPDQLKHTCSTIELSALALTVILYPIHCVFKAFGVCTSSVPWAIMWGAWDSPFPSSLSNRQHSKCLLNEYLASVHLD